jgi:membrane associated rhomboid family serine protease
VGIYDRDYYRTPSRGGFGSFNAFSVTTWLIIVNVAVFVIDGMIVRMAQQHGYDDDVEGGYVRRFTGPVYGPFYTYGCFSIALAIKHLQIWRFITFQFLHEGVYHIFFNMLGLYFFGPMVEGQFGPRRFLAFYLSCGVAGAVMYIVLWATGILGGSAMSPMIGASAGIFGVLIAAAKLAPNMTITLWLPPIPLTLKALAWIYVAIAVYNVLTGGPNAGGEAAHLGGAALGLILINNQHLLNVFVPARKVRRKVAFKDWSREMDR